MLNCKVVVGTTGNKHDPLCGPSEVVAHCSCGWKYWFCEFCPDEDGKSQREKRQTAFGKAISSHLLRDS